MLLKATNIEQAKLINLWVVFDAVRLHGPLSRADIARLTGLSKQTVSNLADELYEAGLLRPEGRKVAGARWWRWSPTWPARCAGGRCSRSTRLARTRRCHG